MMGGLLGASKGAPMDAREPTQSAIGSSRRRRRTGTDVHARGGAERGEGGSGHGESLARAHRLQARHQTRFGGRVEHVDLPAAHTHIEKRDGDEA